MQKQTYFDEKCLNDGKFESGKVVFRSSWFLVWGQWLCIRWGYGSAHGKEDHPMMKAYIHKIDKKLCPLKPNWKICYQSLRK